MIRKIITINKALCNGCGSCVTACHEGAIGLKDGKAVLLRDDYCDGLGDCLPVCPTDAISFEEREADAYDEAAVKAKTSAKTKGVGEKLPCGCPGTLAKAIVHQPCSARPTAVSAAAEVASRLNQWPVQIKLVPINAPYFENAKLLLAADCTAYAYGNFHKDFMQDKITLVGCPKLDEGDYAEKLTAILQQNNLKSITLVRMEVPCCGGLENALKTALQASGKMIPWQVVVISTAGEILEN